MNIVYTFDDGFAEITGVSIISVLENNRSVDEISIYIIDCGICDVNKDKLREIAKIYGRSIYFLEAMDIKKRISIIPKSYSWSMVCYERLFYSEILPHTLKKALHIDCDTIIRGNITDMYNTDISNYYCAACFDCSPKPKRQAGLAQYEPYVSNGLILMNLELWRKNKLPDQFVQYIIEKDGRLPHLDQDVLNAVAGSKIRILPAKYNMMPITIMYQGLCCSIFKKDEPYYTKDEIVNAVSNPIMIHFTGCRYTRRPWDQPCNHWYNGEWITYYRMLKYSETNQLLQQKSRKYLMLKQLIDLSWIKLSSVPIIRYVLFWIDCKYVYKIPRG